MEDELSFKGNDPGAVRFGNFINYYQFHPPETRINNLPNHLWNSSDGNDDHCAVLDMGCNSGNLTNALLDFLKMNSNYKKVTVLGIDIDQNLIDRANETKRDGLYFECIDIMSENANNQIKSHLKIIDKEKFDVIFCFSITMWIHLNFGDTGLDRFLRIVTEISDFIVIEPQPWKCYRNAVRRMKKSSALFPLYSTLSIRSNVETEIENIIVKDGLFEKVFESNSSEWERKILFFSRKRLK